MYSINEQLTIALKRSNTQEASDLLQQGADINYKNSRGETPLFFFASSINMDVVDWLIENNADVNISDNENNTPLLKAILKNDLKMVQKLLDSGADVNIANKRLVTPLMQAVLNENDNGVFDAVLEAGPFLDPVAESQTTPLLAAAARGKIKHVEKLIEAGADIEAADYLGQGLLHSAVLSHEPLMVATVARLAPTLDPNYKARSGTSAMSATMGFPEMTSIFLEMGGDPNAKTVNKIHDGVNLLMSVVARIPSDLPIKEEEPVPAMQDPSGQLLKKMISQGVEISDRDKFGSNAAAYAIRVGSIAPLHDLIQAGLDPSRPVDPQASLPYDLLSHPKIDRDSDLALDLIDEIHQMGFPLSRPKWDESVDGPWKKFHQEVFEKNPMPSPLQLMYMKGFFKAGDKMISLGANVNEKTIGGNSLAHLLVASNFNGMPEHVKKAISLAKKAKNMDEDEKREQIESLQEQADEVFGEICSNLNNFNIDWNSQNKKGETPLHLAAKSGNSFWAKHLVMNENVYLDVKDDEGMSPASSALLNGHVELFNTLCAIAKEKNKELKSTALIESVQASSDDFRERQPWLKAVAVFDWSKEELECVNEEGQTPLYYAAATERHDVVKTLLRLGANPSTFDASKNSALMHAVLNKDGETVRLLRAANVDTRHKNANGQSAQDVANYVNSRYVYNTLSDNDLSELVEDLKVRPLTELEEKQKEIMNVRFENTIRSWKGEDLLEVPEIPKELLEENIKDQKSPPPGKPSTKSSSPRKKMK